MLTRLSGCLAVLVVLAVVAAGCGGGSTFTPSPYQFTGLDFSPYVDGQNPDWGSVVSEQQIESRLAIIRPYTKWVRTYGCSRGLEKTGRIAHQMGMQTACAAWLGTNLSTNETEIAALIAQAQAGHVDVAIVGTETLQRGDLSESQLIQYITRVKEAVPGIPVTTSDTFNQLLDHPAVIQACDVVYANFYPYWVHVSIDDAVSTLDTWYKQVQAASGGKPVVVSETGWPSAGSTGVETEANAEKYLLDFLAWAKANDVQYFYFEAFDENWKAINEGPQGAHWGVWTAAGDPKPWVLSTLQQVYGPEP